MEIIFSTSFLSLKLCDGFSFFGYNLFANICFDRRNRTLKATYYNLLCPVVQRLISAYPGLNFHPGSFVFAQELFLGNFSTFSLGHSIVKL